ncbi:hypothetical protein CUJ91_18480 [Paraburkholderia graminis]|uniref:hypothetical protein n=1 Tax=Paraburkholderia graminis TaxID=60548 RepID=UPI000DF01030|nr:hypothetical protein [Paraburkholderia graminis]AXF10007.1 hypothetical protein CUJ91_18480 [Paraburkholderia graminis]MDR6472232.1 hypothetical protein [Paraburkholderia graminis]
MTTFEQLTFLSPGDMCTGSARLVYLQIETSGERIAIAVLGEFASGAPFARVVTRKVLKCLPDDLGITLHSFGALIVADYLDWSVHKGRPAQWVSPLSGIQTGKAFEVDAEDEEGVVQAALERCSLFHRRPANVSSSSDDDIRVVRPAFENRFAQSVKKEVLTRKPSLHAGFNRTFSLSKSSTGFAIDYVGQAYATCYAAIDPKSKSAVRLRAPSAALWRLARARDSFGFITPDKFELTAWVPSADLPIYSDREYELVSDMVDELRMQASKEDLSVFPIHDARSASKRLLGYESLSVVA